MQRSPLTSKGDKSMIDPSVQQLLEEVIDSPVKLQIVLMFYENRGMDGTASQFANRMYRDIWSTREALRELAEDGILTTTSIAGEPVYRYRPRSEYVDPIFRLVQSYNEPLERDKIQRAIRDIASYAPYRRSSRTGPTNEWLTN
jgi:hypothetical protein